MKKKEIGIGLCGYGAMGRTHAYALAALPYYYDVLPFSARIVAVHTAHADSAQTAAQALSCRAAATLEELLCDPAVDVVDICTPNHTHFSVAKEALAAKKAIYMEKPLCVGAAQARELAALAKQSNVCTQVVFNNRYLSAVLRAKELIDGDRLGRLLSFHFAYRHQSAVDPRRTPTWKQDAACGGGVLRDLGGLKRLLDTVGADGGRSGAGEGSDDGTEPDLPALRAEIARRYAGFVGDPASA